MFNMKRYVIVFAVLAALAVFIAIGMWYWDIRLTVLQVLMILAGILIPVIIVVVYLLIGTPTRTKKDKTMKAVKNAFDDFNKTYDINLTWQGVKFERRRYQMSENAFEDFVAIFAKSKDEGEPSKVIYYNLTTSDIWYFDDKPSETTIHNPWRDFDPLQTKQGFWYRPQHEETKTLPIRLTANQQDYPQVKEESKKKKKKKRVGGYGV